MRFCYKIRKVSTLQFTAMKNISTSSDLPTFNVLTLLEIRELSFGQLGNALKVSRQAVSQAVRGVDDSSRIRVFVSKKLGIKPSILWFGVFDEEKLAIDDFKFSRDS
jgi:hypothetical protein